MVRASGLELSPTKSVVVVFIKSEDTRDLLEDKEGMQLQIDGQEIARQHQARYMGSNG